MDDIQEEKPVVPVPTDETQQPLPEQQRIENIFGTLIRVTTAPTWVPRSFYEGFAVDTTNNRFYFYDFEDNAWLFSQGGATVTAILDAILPSQTGNSGEFLTTNGTTASWAAVGAALYGDGSDGTKTFDGSSTINLSLGGSLVPSGNVYTLTRDIYLDSMTVDSGVTINTASYRIFVKETLSNAGTIKNNGAAGNIGNSASAGRASYPNSHGTGGAVTSITNGTLYGGTQGGAGGNGAEGIIDTGGAGNAGSAGQAGTAVTRSLTTITGSAGSAGGSGGSGSSNGGGGGGAGGSQSTSALSLTPSRNVQFLIRLHEIIGTAVNFLTTCGGAAGGGGGGSGGAQNGVSAPSFSGSGGGGGAGGNSGGIIAIIAKTISNTGTIQANGGAGGNGGSACAVVANTPYALGGGAGAAGGNGGNGGVVILIYNTYTNSGTVQAAGGAGGSAGSGTVGSDGGGTGSNGSASSAGASGLVLTIQNS